MKTDLRVAVVQAGAIPFEVERSVEKAGSLLADAAARGAELAVFPEALFQPILKAWILAAGSACDPPKAGRTSALLGKRHRSPGALYGCAWRRSP